jgi:cytochrome c oxidase assembly protein subunit 15
MDPQDKGPQPMSTNAMAASAPHHSPHLVRAWLYAVAGLVFAMVIVGGATRLTDSGLSITEWQPLLGAIPPLSAADWADAFAKYQAIPEYQIVNKGMSLGEFQFIYWWEWSHRFLGRLIGVAFIVPFIVLWLAGRIERAMVPRLVGLFVLGGLQGGLGWFMVKSGLVERVDVSQYRLAAHLTVAALIYAALIWVGLGLGRPPRSLANNRAAVMALAIVVLVLVQSAAGAFVAGLDAGMGYNTWPLMEGQMVPDGLLIMQPAWRNIFENAMTVQFDHRMLAYVVALAIAVHAARVVAQGGPAQPARSAAVLVVVVVAQVALGIATLIHQVPISLGLVHQGGALILLAAALWHLHVLTCPSPDRDRR